MFSRWQLADLEIKARYGALAATAAIVTPIDGNIRYSHDLSADAVIVGFDCKFSDWDR